MSDIEVLGVLPQISSFDDKSCNIDLISACKDGRLAEIQTLLQMPNININYAENNEHATSALHYASAGNQIAVLQLLLQAGAVVNARDKFGSTPLHDAATLGHLEVVQLLIEKDIQVNKQNKSDWTPLHCASSNDHVNIVKVLLSAGADVNILNYDNKRAIELTQCDDVTALLKSPESDFMKACREGNVDSVKLILTHNTVDVNYCDSMKRTSLHFACWSGLEETVQLLVDEGANVNLQDKTKWTALHYACFNGHTSCVEVLLRNGAGIHLTNEAGNTGLHIASEEGYLSTVVTLLQAQADKTLKNKDGKLPSELASDVGIVNALQSSKKITIIQSRRREEAATFCFCF